MTTNGITRSELAAAFRETGLQPGDSLIVHSSLRSLGYVQGGADTVINGLLEVIGPGGNLMFPTFNSRPAPELYFDPSCTTCLTGIIPETARKRPDAVRSLHPTHSVVVIGPDAAMLTRDHLQFRTVGVGSPIDRLAAMGGKVLLIGVGHTSNTTVHVGEEHARLPKGSWYETLPVFKVRMPDGTLRDHRLDTSPSCSAGFGAVEHEMRRCGLIRDVRIGAAKLQIMSGAELIKAVVRLITEKADVLLCTRTACKPCEGTRRNLRYAGLIP